MSKRGENIHKRRDGRWEGRYIKRRDLNGAIIYGSVYGKTYRETKDKLLNMTAQQRIIPMSKKRELIFEEILHLWMQNNQIHQKKATTTKYQYMIEKHILPELGSIQVSKINATMINSFLIKKAQNGRLDKKGGLSASYVRSIMLIIRSALKFAADEQLCPPLKSPIYRPISVKKELSILSKEEQNKLEYHLLTELNPTGLGILISLHTGLRIGEICALSWDDIDLDNRIIHVRHTVARIKNPDATCISMTKLIIDTPKTISSLRDVPISSSLLSVMQKANVDTSFNYVVSESDNFISPRTFEYRYHRLLMLIGLRQFNYHTLRHTFATRCVEAGVDVKSLSEILGHSNVSITLNTYVHSSMEMKRNQLEKLNTLTS